MRSCAARPKIATELIERPDRSLEAMIAEALDPTAVRMDLETIVSKTGRPVLTIQSNDFLLKFTDVESEVWRNRLTAARDRLRRRLPAVGRVDLDNNPNYSWVGTAWLVADNVVVTNRHVAAIFGQKKGERFVFRTASGLGKPMAARIDFLEEANSPAAARVRRDRDPPHRVRGWRRPGAPAGRADLGG